MSYYSCRGNLVKDGSKCVQCGTSHNTHAPLARQGRYLDCDGDEMHNGVACYVCHTTHNTMSPAQATFTKPAKTADPFAAFPFVGKKDPEREYRKGAARWRIRQKSSGLFWTNNRWAALVGQFTELDVHDLDDDREMVQLTERMS